MASVYFDKIRETTTTTGTGTVTLGGAPTGFLPFSTIGDGKQCYYIIDDGGANFEVGQGTYTLAGTTLSRTTILASSNSNAAVNFAAGTKNVRLGAPANFYSNAARIDFANTFTQPQIIKANAASDVIGIFKGASGQSGHYIECNSFGGSGGDLFYINSLGGANFAGTVSFGNDLGFGGGTQFTWAGSTIMRPSGGDGTMRLTNNAVNDWTALQFGGISASFPAIGRSGATLKAILADNSGDAPFSCLNITFGADTMTYAATISLDVTKAALHKTTTVNATGNATINASAGGNAGQQMSVLIANDATSGKVITFGTNFKSSGTVTGTVNKSALVKFESDGTNWFEASRTLAL
jgi:hypothetical protein